VLLKRRIIHYLFVLLQDGHEICFVGDEGFKDLSQVDPQGNQLLNDAMEADKSKEWYAKKGRTKESA
jgi:hypothetical protein